MFLLEDRDLLHRFREGNRETLEIVYRHYAPRLARLIARGVWYRKDGESIRLSLAIPIPGVEDLLQETFSIAFRRESRLSYSGYKPYFSYLAAIVRNLLLKQFRGRKLFADNLVIDEERFEATTPSPEELYEQRELSQLAIVFVDGLKGKEAKVFRSRFIERHARRDLVNKLMLSEMQLRHCERRLIDRFGRYLSRRGYTFSGSSRSLERLAVG